MKLIKSIESKASMLPDIPSDQIDKAQYPSFFKSSVVQDNNLANNMNN